MPQQQPWHQTATNRTWQRHQQCSTHDKHQAQVPGRVGGGQECSHLVGVFVGGGGRNGKKPQQGALCVYLCGLKRERKDGGQQDAKPNSPCTTALVVDALDLDRVGGCALRDHPGRQGQQHGVRRRQHTVFILHKDTCAAPSLPALNLALCHQSTPWLAAPSPYRLDQRRTARQTPILPPVQQTWAQPPACAR